MRKPTQNTARCKQEGQWKLSTDMPIDWITAWVYITKHAMLAQKALEHGQETHIYIPNTSNFK